MHMLFAFAAGVGLAVQALINARLRVELASALWAALIQVVVGLAILAVMVLVARQPPVTSTLSRAPWWVWTGGILGAAYVLASIVTTPKLGTALMVTLVIAGQLSGALLMDHYGWFGASVHRLSAGRLVGAVLLALGAILIRFR